MTTISGNHNYLNPQHASNQLNMSPPTTNSNEIRFFESILRIFRYDKFINVTRYGKGISNIDIFI